MFGHKWEPASGTIAESRVEQAAGGTPGQVRVFVVEARQRNGHVVRATLVSPWGVSVDLPPGVPVKLEVHGKTGEVRFDVDPHGPAPVAPGAPSAPLTGVRDARQLARQLRGEMTSGGDLAGALAGLAQGDGAPGIHVESTLQVNGGPVRALGGAEVAELMHDLMGGGDRKSAMDRIVQLQAQAQAAAQRGAAAQPGAGQPEGAAGQPTGPAAPVGFSSPDGQSAFDPRSPSSPGSSASPASAGPLGAAPATFSSPADLFGSPADVFGSPGGPGTTARPAGAVGFSSPAAPPPAFGSGAPGTPAAPGGGFGSFSAGSFSAGSDGQDSFGTGSAGGGSSGTFGGTKADRIARLAYQRDHGQLTDEQFQAQSRQIMDEF